MPVENNVINEREFVRRVLENFNLKVIKFNTKACIDDIRSKQTGLDNLTSADVNKQAKEKKDVPSDKLKKFLDEAFHEVCRELSVVGNTRLETAGLREKINGGLIFEECVKFNEKNKLYDNLIELKKSPKEIEEYLMSLNPKQAEERNLTAGFIIKAKAVVLPIKGVEKFHLSYETSTSLLSVQNEGTNNMQAFYCPCPDFIKPEIKMHYIQALLAYLTNEIALAVMKGPESHADKLLRGVPMRPVEKEKPNDKEIRENFNAQNTQFYDDHIEKFNVWLKKIPEVDRDRCLLNLCKNEELFFPKYEVIRKIKAYIKKTEELSLTQIFGNSKKTALKVMFAKELIRSIEESKDISDVIKHIEFTMSVNDNLEDSSKKGNRFGDCLAQSLNIVAPHKISSAINLKSAEGEESTAFQLGNNIPIKKSSE